MKDFFINLRIKFYKLTYHYSIRSITITIDFFIKLLNDWSNFNYCEIFLCIKFWICNLCGQSFLHCMNGNNDRKFDESDFLRV